jgi:hypothetical protein
MPYRISIAGLVCALVLCSVAAARPSGFVVSHWICDMATEPVIARTVAVGCEVVDTTLGCTSGSPLTLQLKFNAPSGATAELDLTNPPAGLQPAVGTQNGSATRTSASRIVMTPGAAMLSGFTSDAATVPMLTVTIKVPPSAFPAPAASWLNAWLSGPESAAQVTLDLMQIVGRYETSRTSIRHYYYSCRSRDSLDRIAVGNRGNSTGAVALVDAKAGASCLEHDGYRGIPFIALPNLFAKDLCLERETLFSNAKGVQFQKTSSFWHDAAGETMQLDLAEMARQRVRIWVLYNPCPGPGACPPFMMSEMKQRPARHLENAARVYAEQFGGIAFERTVNTDLSASTSSELRTAVDRNQLQCDQANTPNTLTLLKSFTGLTAAEYSQQLNVFYVKHPGGWGIWCGVYDPYGIGRDTILLHASALPDTLAHEIGHALLNSGAHVEDLAGFTSAHWENLMVGQFVGEQLTLGQLFRASLSPDSPVNRHGGRPGGATAACWAIPGSPESCPNLPLDVTPR